METEQHYPCPACGFIVFDEAPGSYEICPVCNWEDDHVQLAHPAMGGGANKESLYEHQQILVERIPFDIREHHGYQRDSAWRPLLPEEYRRWIPVPETGIEYFQAAGEESPKYYWQRDIS